MTKKSTFSIQAIITLFTLLFMSSWAMAYPAQSRQPAPPAAPTYTPSDPTYIIHTTLDKITTFSSKSDKVNPAKLRGFIENQIIPHFDFNYMSHWITGRYADNMDDKEKAEFQQKLRETFLSSLSKHLGSFDAENTRVRFQKARYRGPEEAFVRTTVFRPDTMAVRLDFRMKRDGDNWKIIDVRANGSSAVIYYRRHFMSQLRSYNRPVNMPPTARPPQRVRSY